jgi:imidazolonepropionase-like amidohydrolase
VKKLLIAAAAMGAAFPATAQTVAVTNARLVIGDGSAPVEGGTVVVRDGRVVAAGAGCCGSGRRAGDRRRRALGHAGPLRGL